MFYFSERGEFVLWVYVAFIVSKWAFVVKSQRSNSLQSNGIQPGFVK